MHRLFGRFLLVPWCLALAGCTDDRPPTYPVTGKVVLPDGKPLAGGSILFESVEHALAARGLILQDGTFRLGTFGLSDGAVAGPHRVAIIPAYPDDFDPDGGPPPRTIDHRYTTQDTSGLEYTVTEKGPNHFQIEVELGR